MTAINNLYPVQAWLMISSLLVLAIAVTCLIRAVIRLESALSHALSQSQSKNNPSTPSVAPSASNKGKKACGYYLKQSQLWNRSTETWDAYDPADDTTEDTPEGQFYFHVYQRFQKRQSSPRATLCNFDPILLRFLRACIGGPFYLRPEVDSHKFRNWNKTLLKYLCIARQAIEAEHLEDINESDRRLLHRIGYNYDRAADDKKSIDEELSILVDQLDGLLAFVRQENREAIEQQELAKSHGRISYESLPYFFEIGEEVLTTDRSSSEEDGVENTPRLYSLSPGFESQRYNRPQKSDNQPMAFILTEILRRESDRDRTVEDICFAGYGMQWNGTDYVRWPVKRIVKKFQGTINICELPCLPLTPEKKEELQERGKRYKSLSGVHHMSYRGQRIMIDRKAYDRPEGYVSNSSISSNAETIQDSELFLLDPHVYGFNLAVKEWSNFVVSEVKKIDFDKDAWEHLVLSSDIKDMIKGLVEVSRSNSGQSIVSDVISGKGGGMIAVLHGPPGTGKTLTAESVAELLNRPLYTLGAFELSLQPDVMDRRLRGALNRSNAWDAVTLIDEADVFLEERQNDSIDRNSLVSIALRALEYHKGVLFLTTNRIGVFDSAFMSRFSITLKYPRLEERERQVLWARFFKLANCPTDGTEESPRVSPQDLVALAGEPFNGRMIKNLVRTAHTLAISKNELLSIKHVNFVVQVQKKFIAEFKKKMQNPGHEVGSEASG